MTLLKKRQTRLAYKERKYPPVLPTIPPITIILEVITKKPAPSGKLLGVSYAWSPTVGCGSYCWLLCHYCVL